MNSLSKAVLFDMDGVVLDTEPLYTKAEIRLFKEYGVIIPEEDWSLFRGCSEKTFFDLSMKRYNITEDRHIFMEKGREYVRDEFIKSLTFNISSSCVIYFGNERNAFYYGWEYFL